MVGRPLHKCIYNSAFMKGKNVVRIHIGSFYLILLMKRCLLMASYYYQNLIKSVLEASTTDKWEIAVREWDIVDCQEDEKHLSECVCGKENLRYLFTIRNRKTGISLYPIGSTCIEKFGRDDLDSEVNVQLDMYHLVHAIESGERIELTSKYFSKKLLLALYEEGAFSPNQYNGYDGKNDYQFMLDMYNKRNKSNITEQQHRKIRGLIAYSIKPFLRKRLKYK